MTDPADTQADPIRIETVGADTMMAAVTVTAARPVVSAPSQIRTRWRTGSGHSGSERSLSATCDLAANSRSSPQGCQRVRTWAFQALIRTSRRRLW